MVIFQACRLLDYSCLEKREKIVVILHKKAQEKNLTNRFFANIMPLQKEIEV